MWHCPCMSLWLGLQAALQRNTTHLAEAAWENAILQGAQHPLPATQPASPGQGGSSASMTWHRAEMCCALSAPPPQHKACAGAGQPPAPPDCLLPLQRGATSNFPSWLQALP